MFVLPVLTLFVCVMVWKMPMVNGEIFYYKFFVIFLLLL